MATINIPIPPALIAAMQNLVAAVGKTQVLMSQINNLQTKMAQASAFKKMPSGLAPAQVFGFMNRLPSLFQRFASTLARSIDRMMILLGPKVRTLVRTFVMPNYIFSGVNTLVKLAGAMSAGRFAMLFRFGGAASLVASAVRWIFEKSIALMETVQKDRIQALVMGTTIGGLRAFRTAFWMLPEDPLLMHVMGGLRGDAFSKQALQIFGTLKVQRNIDTIEGMIQVLLNAQKLLRKFPGYEYQMARELGIPLSRESITAILSSRTTPKKLKEAASRELNLRGIFNITEEEEENTMNFLNAKRILFATAKITILKGVVSSGLADVLIRMSEGLTRWLKSFETSPVTPFKTPPDKSSSLGKAFEKKVAEIDRYMVEEVRKIKDHLARLSSMAGEFSLISSAAAAGGEGPGGLAGRVRRGAVAARAGGGVGGGGGGGRRGGRVGGRGDKGDGGYRGTVPQPPSPTTGGRWPNIANIKASAKDQLIREGLTPEQAEVGANGLVGQAIAESGLVSQYHDLGKGGRPGYVQSIYGADYQRGQAMLRWMADNHLDPNDTANQGRWMAHEVMSNPRFSKSQEALRRGNQDEVSDALTLNYEAPAAPNLNERRRNARTVAGVGPPSTKVPVAPAAPAPPIRTFIPPDIPAGMGPMVSDRLKSEGVTLPAAVDAKIRNGEKLTEGDLQSIPKDQLEKTNTLVTGMGRPPLYKDAPAPVAAPAPVIAPAPAERGPGQWSDLPPERGKVISGAPHMWNPGPVDPRVREIVSAARDRFEEAHPGYKVVGSSGLRTSPDPHGRGHAIDRHIVDPNGNVIYPYGQDATGLYTELATMERREMRVRHPELERAWNWGGFFDARGTGLANPWTGEGRSDLEHVDIEGERPNRGSWMYEHMKLLDKMKINDQVVPVVEKPEPKSNTIIDDPDLLNSTPAVIQPKKDEKEEPQKDDPPQHPEEKEGKLTHPALKEVKVQNRSDAKVDVKWNGSAGSNLTDVQTASPMRRRGQPVNDSWSKQTNLMSPKSMVTTPPPELDSHEEERDPVPVRALAFVRAIGRTESEFSRREAYSDANNQLTGKGANSNMIKLKKAGKDPQYAADYGYYQANQEQVDDAVRRYGISRDTAQHLTGGPNHDSTLEQQTRATAILLKAKFPNEYKDLVEKGDYQGMVHAARGTWFGLADPPQGKPKDNAAEYQRVMDAARINAAAVMGGRPTTSGEMWPSVPPPSR